jgi:hypothetical protein
MLILDELEIFNDLGGLLIYIVNLNILDLLHYANIGI